MKDEMKMTFTQTITREEMKDKISMALKDPILQQGFEIICKNLTDLENKIADIKANCDLAIEGRDIKIKELEQQIEKMKNCYNCAGYMTKQCVGCEDYCNWQLRRLKNDL